MTGADLPFTAAEGKGPPDYLLMSAAGDHVYVAWRDGTLLHFATRDFDHPKLVEQIDLVADPAQSLTALEFLLGKTTLLAGDSTGEVKVWFCVKPAGNSNDPAQLVAAHTLAGSGSPATCIAVSGNSRLLAVGCADRSVRLYYPTNQRLVLATGARRRRVRGVSRPSSTNWLWRPGTTA